MASQPHLWLRLGESPGTCYAMTLAVRFVRWMDSRATPAKWQDVAEHFDVSRATAYRWLQSYRDGSGKQ